MPDTTVRTTVTIQNPQGLHMRPAYMFAETAAQFASRIEVAKDSVRIDGKSVLSILTLGATQGSDVSIEAIGDDAQEAVDTLSGLVTSGFAAPDIGDTD